MLSSKTLRTPIVLLQVGALLVAGNMFGCSGDKSSISAPEVGGPMAGGAFPGLGTTLAKAARPTGLWATANDVNGDGRLDIVIAHRTLNKVKVHRATGVDEFAELPPVIVNAPRDVASGDVNGDTAPDLAVYSPAGNRVTVFTNNGAGSFTQVASVVLPGAAGGISIKDFDGNGAGDILLSNGNPQQAFRVSDGLSGYQYSLIDATGFPAARELDTKAAAIAINCGDEPDCDVHAGEGIQECMRAAWCRYTKCIWAACILHTDHWYEYPLWVASSEACAAVFIIENALCLPTQLIPTGGSATVSAHDLSPKTDVAVARTLNAAQGVTAQIRYFVSGGEVRVQVTTLQKGNPVPLADETYVAGTYTTPLRVTDDGQGLGITYKSSGQTFGLPDAEQKIVAQNFIARYYPAGITAREIGPITIPLGRCCLVIGWGPPEYPGCLVAVLACDTDGDFKPDYCRLFIWCPGSPVRISDCSGQISTD